MILVANPAKPFEFTPKGTPRKSKIINEYEVEIEFAYSPPKGHEPVPRIS